MAKIPLHDVQRHTRLTKRQARDLAILACKAGVTESVYVRNAVVTQMEKDTRK